MQQATQRVLTVRHTCDKSRQPLAVIDGLPGLGAELHPADLRRLARQLNTIANDADQGARGQIIYGQEVA